MAHPDNDMYGHRQALAAYCGVDGLPVIWGLVQHGWSYELPVAEPPRLPRWLPLFVYTEANAALARRHYAHVTPIGAPFLYLREHRRARSGAADDAPRQGPSTIYYPYHGHERLNPLGSHAELADAIEAREEHPVTVCLYWKEHDDPTVRREYEQRGFRIVCHGRKADPDFVGRQYDELRRHTRVAGNRVMTAIWYGASLGLEAEVYGPTMRRYPGEEFEPFQRSGWPDLCAGGIAGAPAVAMAEHELGRAHLLPPDDLVDRLGWRGRRATAGPAYRVAVRADFHARRAGANLRAMREPAGRREVLTRVRGELSRRGARLRAGP